MLPLIISGLFLKSDIAAIGIPQFNTGPQKCVLNFLITLLNTP